MAPRKLVAYGHSHLAAMMRAYKEREAEEPDPTIEAQFEWLGRKPLQPNFELIGFGKLKSARKEGEEIYQAMADRLRGPGAEAVSKGEKVRALSEKLETFLRGSLAEQKPDAILLICMGNEYNSLGMLRHPRPFDFTLPGSDLPLIEGAEVIPHGMMKDHLRETVDNNALLFWRFFNDVAGDVPIYMVPPPPPIASEEHILSFPGAFADRAGEYGISPVSLRRKLWLLYCEVLRDGIAGTGTTFVDLPPVVFTDGCLSRQFWQKDPTHGNLDYGLVVLDHVLDLAFEQPAEV